MVNRKTDRLGPEDWLQAALEMCPLGLERVKIVPLATKLGVTTGSFYWHFKNRQQLLDAMLKHWEKEMTDRPIAKAREFSGTAEDRILFLMKSVMDGNFARYDLPIWALGSSGH